MKKILTVAALAALLATNAAAQGGRGFGRALAPAQTATPGERLERRLELLAAYLNLSEGQKAQFKAAYEALAARTQATQQKMQELRSKLWEAVQANQAAAISPLAAELGKLHGELIAARAQTMLTLRNLLTQQQRDKLDKLCPQGCGLGGFGGRVSGLVRGLGNRRGWRL